VVIADIVMSLDNVIAVAAAANGQIPLLILGLAISIPVIVAGAALVMMVLNRLPILVWLGAALLGWIAGDVIVTDPAVHPFLLRLDGRIAGAVEAAAGIFGLSPHFGLDGDLIEYIASVLGAVTVLAAGSVWRRHRLRQLERIAADRAAIG
jgi:predicted tellurium resistance membrane protein TerC